MLRQVLLRNSPLKSFDFFGNQYLGKIYIRKIYVIPCKHTIILGYIRIFS